MLGPLTYGSLAATTQSFVEQMAALPGLLAYWKLDETSGTTAADSSGNGYDGTYDDAATLNSVALPASIGGSAPDFGPAPSTSTVTLPHATLDGGWDGDTGYIVFLAKPSAAQFTDGNDHTHFVFKTPSPDTRQLYFSLRGAVDHSIRISRRSDTLKVADWWTANSDWQLWCMIWDNGTLELWLDGVKVGEAADLVGWSGTMDLARIGNWLGAQYNGGLAHFAVGAGSVPTKAQINDLFDSIWDTARSFVASGDSKSDDNNDIWQSLLLVNLDGASNTKWREETKRLAVGGYDAEDLNDYLVTEFAAGLDGPPDNVLLNIGANDFFKGTSESFYKTELRGILDSFVTNWATAQIYVAYPWRQGYDTEADAMKSWINDVLSEYGDNVQAGHDETDWFKTGVATYSDDGIHYNAAGAAELANQWQTVLGY